MTKQEAEAELDQITASLTKLAAAVKQSMLSAMDASEVFAAIQVALDKAFEAIGPELDNEVSDEDESDEGCPCGDPDCSRPFGHHVD